MIKLIDLTYYTHNEFTLLSQVLQRHKEAVGYVKFIKRRLDIQVIKHINNEGSAIIDDIKYTCFKSKNKFIHIPFKTHKYIQRQRPDVVLVQGLGFPFQVIFLRLAVGKRCKIIVQYHAERPFKGFKKAFQKIADKLIDAYFFTAMESAEPWFKENIISNRGKCYEVLEASTFFTKQNKQESRLKLNIGDGDIFLWVGRLEANKDPVTVLAGFEKFLEINKDARLFMIYQETDLISKVVSMIDNSKLLKKSVTLMGKIEHNALADWYSAADYYISGSHREAAGYALIEAVACGCIPVITNIPSFRKIGGDYSFFFEPGDSDSLSMALFNASNVPKEQFSMNMVSYFNEQLSLKKIADDTSQLCNMLMIK